MPIYEFFCRQCQKPFELVRSISELDVSQVRCPACGGSQIDRRWSSVFAVTAKKS